MLRQQLVDLLPRRATVWSRTSFGRSSSMGQHIRHIPLGADGLGLLLPAGVGDRARLLLPKDSAISCEHSVPRCPGWRGGWTAGEAVRHLFHDGTSWCRWNFARVRHTHDRSRYQSHLWHRRIISSDSGHRDSVHGHFRHERLLGIGERHSATKQRQHGDDIGVSRVRVHRRPNGVSSYCLATLLCTCN